jgi:hypothetical protein
MEDEHNAVKDRLSGMVFGSILGYLYGASHIPKVEAIPEDCPDIDYSIDWRVGIDPMMSVLNTLIEQDFTIDLKTTAEKLKVTYTTTCNSHPSLSGAIRETFADIEYCENPEKVTQRHWIDLGRQLATNDIFCPVTPLVLMERRFESVMVLSTIIQPDIRSLVSAGIYTDILYYLIWEPTKTTDDIIRGASESVRVFNADEAKAAVMRLIHHAYTAPIHDQGLGNPYTKFVYRGLTVAVYVLHVIKVARGKSANISFKSLMENIAHEGGDTTINCQIAGTILGAYLGYKKLPAEWVSQLPYQDLATDLAAALGN